MFPFVDTRCGHAARQVSIVPCRLMSMSSRHCSTGSSGQGPMLAPPAFATSTSRCPYRSSAASITAHTDASLVMSAAMKDAPVGQCRPRRVACTGDDRRPFADQTFDDAAPDSRCPSGHDRDPAVVAVSHRRSQQRHRI